MQEYRNTKNTKQTQFTKTENGDLRRPVFGQPDIATCYRLVFWTCNLPELK